MDYLNLAAINRESIITGPLIPRGEIILNIISSSLESNECIASSGSLETVDNHFLILSDSLRGAKFFDLRRVF